MYNLHICLSYHLGSSKSPSYYLHWNHQWYDYFLKHAFAKLKLENVFNLIWKICSLYLVLKLLLFTTAYYQKQKIFFQDSLEKQLALLLNLFRIFKKWLNILLWYITLGTIVNNNISGDLKYFYF